MSEPAPRAGRSPGREAWRRFCRNRRALWGARFVGAVGLCGLLAPVLSAHVLQLSEDEQHSFWVFAPPGTADVSRDFPSYDGDKAIFALLDQDGDGRLTCSRATPTAPLSCPELETAWWAERFFAFLHDLRDTAIGQAVPQPERRSPDGRISRAEYPRSAADWHDARVAAAVARLGLFGAAGFARLDRDGDGLVSKEELIAQTRWTRFDSARLLAACDANGDLAIDRAEFPGQPVLRTFWLGTDQKGRDLLVRLLYGARVSLAIALLATLVSVLIGVSYGALSGWLGGRWDGLMMRIVDVLYGLPFLFLVILLLVVAGRSTVNLFVALGAVSWLSMARIVRGQVQSLKRRPFVEAAVAMGVAPGRILWRHVLPNALGPIVVYATLAVPAVIIEEAFLSFLGLGVQPPAASWGTLISEGARLMAQHPWLILYPGGLLTATLFALHFVGDGLRDALDPRGD